MRGRGLLVAAAILQLVGAGIFFFVAVGQIVVVVYGHEPRATPFFVIGAFGGATTLAYGVVSIALMRGRRWAWIASLALDGLSALSLASLPLLGGVGLGELIILAAILGVPLLVTIGLLVGGRHAVLTPSAKTAAEPTVSTRQTGA